MHTEERDQSAKEKAAITLLFFSIASLMKKTKQNQTLEETVAFWVV